MRIKLKKLIKNKQKLDKLPMSDIIEKMALKIVRTGTDKTNFKILEMLPSSIELMMLEFNLTKVPVNVRVNKLEKAFLVKRFKGTGNVVLTDFGSFFIDNIKSYEEIVRIYILDIITKHMELR